MEARIGDGNYGKKSLEWDLNDWRWDGERFLATPVNADAAPLFRLSSLSSACSGDVESEKRRRVEEAGSLALKLGGEAYPIGEAEVANWEGRNGVKRGKGPGGAPNRATCQVEGCGVDLSESKEYHRRHKVCETHAKANSAVVGNVTQRFCQQCSRFHLLQEFDEGKRSCRRRLAGHNRRRRKTHPDSSVNGISLTDDQASSYLLITLIEILSNLPPGGSDQSKDKDFLSHLLRNIPSTAGSSDASSLSRLLQASQNLHKHRTSAGTSSEANPFLSNCVAAQDFSRLLCTPSKMTTCITGTQGPSLRPIDSSVPTGVAQVEMYKKRNDMEASLGETAPAVHSQISATLVPVENVLSARTEAICSLKCSPPAEYPVEGVRLNDFDLNDTYNETKDSFEGCEQSVIPGTVGLSSPDCPSGILQDSHQSSPPQTSGNSERTSGHSLSNSNGDVQSRTDRIVFKLFGKDPNDFPLSLRCQVLDWLDNSPTDMESYIRPGCIVLTVYLRLAESAWEELSHDLNSSLKRLLLTSDHEFWRTGWIYARIQRRITFIYDGQIMLDTPLHLKDHDNCGILSITPIAVSISARVNFIVKGFNIARPTVRLLCAFEGRYMVPETLQPFVEDAFTTKEHDGSQFCSFLCSLPNATGRGFIEVEDNGLSSGFFPFVVAEEDVCSEIRMLERIIRTASHARNQAIEFLHEMGWLLRRSHLRSSSEQMDTGPEPFPLTRFRWLMAFAMDRDWCAVVKKLLNVLFQGYIELGGHSSVELALSEDLLHSAVRKNCKPMVELLLRYTPDTASKDTGSDKFLFKPNMLSSANITPLHIAASVSGSEGVLDSLTDDPGQLGIKAWNSVHDVTGFTPEDYARSRGFESYIDLVQRKISKRLSKNHLILDIPGTLSAYGKPAAFEIDHRKFRPIQQPSCRLCDQKRMHRNYRRRSLLYRPVMLSMVGIAAVCVCVSLILKGPPDVICVKPPFRWESLGYGWI